MTEGNTYHKVVDLVLRRIESHPEEFANGTWDKTIDQIYQFASEPEAELVRSKTRVIMLDKAYEDMCMRLYVGEDEGEDTSPMKSALRQAGIGKGISGGTLSSGTLSGLNQQNSSAQMQANMVNQIAQQKLYEQYSQQAMGSLQGLTNVTNDYAHMLNASALPAREINDKERGILRSALKKIEDRYTTVKKGGI